MVSLNNLNKYGICEERANKIAEMILNLKNISFECPPQVIYDYIYNNCNIVLDNEKQLIKDKVIEQIFELNKN